MKIGFPVYGTTWVAVKGLLQFLGLNVAEPVLPGPWTLAAGRRILPEGSGLHELLQAGSLYEAAERGADTFIVLGGRDFWSSESGCRCLKDYLESRGGHVEYIECKNDIAALWRLCKKIKRLK